GTPTAGCAASGYLSLDPGSGQVADQLGLGLLGAVRGCGALERPADGGGAGSDDRDADGDRDGAEPERGVHALVLEELHGDVRTDRAAGEPDERVRRGRD